MLVTARMTWLKSLRDCDRHLEQSAPTESRVSRGIKIYIMAEVEGSILSRVLSRSRDFSKSDLEIGCHWVKQCTSLAAGVGCGLTPVTGVYGLLVWAIAILFATFLTYSSVMKADLELLGSEGQVDLMKEGGMAAIATFVLSWTVFYSVAHPVV